MEFFTIYFGIYMIFLHLLKVGYKSQPLDCHFGIAGYKVNL